MPKDPPKPRSARAPRKLSSTEERRLRAQKICSRSAEMPFRCNRCEEKNLRCFVDTATGHCAGCIAAHAECSLFVPEKEWEKAEEEERATELALARSEAESARLRVELLEVKSRKQEFARRDLAILRVHDQVQGQAQEVESSSTTVPLPLDPPADLGWSQANNLLLDPSFDQFLANLPDGSFFDNLVVPPSPPLVE